MPKHSAVTNDILACCGAADTSICTGGRKQEKPEKGFKADLRKQQVMRPRGNANAELAERATDY